MKKPAALKANRLVHGVYFALFAGRLVAVVALVPVFAVHVPLWRLGNGVFPTLNLAARRLYMLLTAYAL